MSESLLKCENCGCLLGKLEDAHVWLDRAVCEPCFKRLSVKRAARDKGLWITLTSALGVAVIGLAIAVGLLMSRLRDGARASGNSAASSAQDSEGDSASPPTVAASAPMTKDQVIKMLLADRTWYWHWEKSNKDRPTKFIEDNHGAIVTPTDAKNPYELQQRWVILHDGHIFVPINDHELRGFFVRTGRAAGYFTDQRTTVAK